MLTTKWWKSALTVDRLRDRGRGAAFGVCTDSAHIFQRTPAGTHLDKCSITLITPQILAERCNCIAKFGYCHNMSSVWSLFVTRVYCDKTTEVRISRSFHLKVIQCLNFSVVTDFNDRSPCGAVSLYHQYANNLMIYSSLVPQLFVINQSINQSIFKVA